MATTTVARSRFGATPTPYFPKATYSRPGRPEGFSRVAAVARRPRLQPQQQPQQQQQQQQKQQQQQQLEQMQTQHQQRIHQQQRERLGAQRRSAQQEQRHATDDATPGISGQRDETENGGDQSQPDLLLEVHSIEVTSHGPGAPETIYCEVAPGWDPFWDGQVGDYYCTSPRSFDVMGRVCWVTVPKAKQTQTTPLVVFFVRRGQHLSAGTRGSSRIAGTIGVAIHCEDPEAPPLMSRHLELNLSPVALSAPGSLVLLNGAIVESGLSVKLLVTWLPAPIGFRLALEQAAIGPTSVGQSREGRTIPTTDALSPTDDDGPCGQSSGNNNNNNDHSINANTAKDDGDPEVEEEAVDDGENADNINSSNNNNSNNSNSSNNNSNIDEDTVADTNDNNHNNHSIESHNAAGIIRISIPGGGHLSAQGRSPLFDHDHGFHTRSVDDTDGLEGPDLGIAASATGGAQQEHDDDEEEKEEELRADDDYADRSDPGSGGGGGGSGGGAGAHDLQTYHFSQHPEEDDGASLSWPRGPSISLSPRLPSRRPRRPASARRRAFRPVAPTSSLDYGSSSGSGAASCLPPWHCEQRLMERLARAKWDVEAMEGMEEGMTIPFDLAGFPQQRPSSPAPTAIPCHSELRVAKRQAKKRNDPWPLWAATSCSTVSAGTLHATTERVACLGESLEDCVWNDLETRSLTHRTGYRPPAPAGRGIARGSQGTFEAARSCYQVPTRPRSAPRSGRPPTRFARQVPRKPSLGPAHLYGRIANPYRE